MEGDDKVIHVIPNKIVMLKISSEITDYLAEFYEQYFYFPSSTPNTEQLSIRKHCLKLNSHV